MVPKWAIGVVGFQLITIGSGSFAAIHDGSKAASVIPTLRRSVESSRMIFRAGSSGCVACERVKKSQAAHLMAHLKTLIL